MLVLLLGGVLPLFGTGQAAALQQYSAPQILISSQNFPIDIAADQITSTTSVKTATVTTTSTSRVSQTKTATASTTIATTTTYLNRTRTTTASTTIATTTTYLNRTRTTTASTTVATTTSYLSRTATTTASSTVGTTTAYVSQTATTTAPTTVATTTNYVNQTATATTSSTLSTTTTALVNSTQTVTATSTITTTAATSTVPSTPTGLLIPLFIYPTTVSTWSSIAALPAAYPNVPVIAIINPDSGPGSSQDPNYVAGINSLKASGVVTVGYVWTNYGAVSLQSVESSIDAWKNLYGVTGIFLDAMAYHTGYESYYQSIETYAKGTDGMSIVIGNPGTDTVASYVGNGGVDNIGFYEDFGTPTISYLSSTFHTSYPKTEWSFLAHGVASLNDSFIAQASQYVSYLYVSSGPGSAPWGTIPSYLNQMAADLAKANPPAQTIKASPSVIGSNPIGINNDYQVSSGYGATDFSSFSFLNSRNVLISIAMTVMKFHLSTSPEFRPEVD